MTNHQELCRTCEGARKCCEPDAFLVHQADNQVQLGHVVWWLPIWPESRWPIIIVLHPYRILTIYIRPIELSRTAILGKAAAS